MIHKSELEKYSHQFPHDTMGYVPTRGDCWREMKFDHADRDPDQKGISADERARRTEYLDRVWWPTVVAKVKQERERLEEAHGESFVGHWERAVNREPSQAHGFEVE